MRKKVKNNYNIRDYTDFLITREDRGFFIWAVVPDDIISITPEFGAIFFLELKPEEKFPIWYIATSEQNNVCLWVKESILACVYEGVPINERPEITVKETWV